MIKLKHLIREINLMSGDAGYRNSLEDFFGNIINDFKILPTKYKIVYDWLLINRGLPIDSIEMGADTENKVNKLIIVNNEFKSIIDSKTKLVASSGGYQLRMQKYANQIVFHLVDTKAKYIYEYFVGIIKTEFGNHNYRFDSRKAFNLKCYQIHWSNVAEEKMGQGLGKLMYTMVYEYVNGLGAALVSDRMLFQGSQKMWFDYIPTIAKFFGVVLEDIFFPIDKSEINRDVMRSTVDTVVAMENPPKEIRKLAYNVQGLSFKKGQYGMMPIRAGINDKIALKAGEASRTFDYDSKAEKWIAKPNKNFQYTMFSNLVDESPTIIMLLKKMEGLDMCDRYDLTSRTAEPSDLKACVFSFTNANVIVKETGGRLVMVAI